MKKILAICAIACVHLNAAIYFESTTSVNRTNHQVTLNVSGSAGQPITIERFCNPTLDPQYHPVAAQHWSNIATLTLNGSGKGTVTVGVHDLNFFGDMFSSRRYGVYRAYQSNNTTNQSTNAFMAFYFTYAKTNTTYVFANMTTAKSIADIIVNPHDGLTVYTLNASGNYESCIYDTFFGGWDGPITINTGIGFRVDGSPNLSGVTLDLSGLFDEATVSVPIAASGFRFLSCSQPVSLYEQAPGEGYGSPIGEYFGAPGYRNTETLPKVDGSYIDLWDSTTDDWDGPPAYLEYDSTIGWMNWDGSSLFAERRIEPHVGYLFYNPSGSSVTWQFNRQIWP